MFLDESGFLEPMKLVYELKKELEANPQKMRDVHALTLDKSKPSMGLSGRNGLYGTDEWWENIEKSVIPTKKVSGTIEELYVAGMEAGEVNEFKFVCDDDWSSKSESIYFNNEEDKELFIPGSRVEMLYVLEELKNGIRYPLLLEMAVSQ
ncbi:hypothetical protein BTA51_28460 [Hahella sp. CCB-MM4]|uniref:hypothetical protein n=1 Tax=Hahella sp. (strain CCB-MM4) TaxID=1926491 RepID=UPI000B9BD84C|nr:hypothetical protein [Hahella sp. CCB-MM4]OZG69972.1 hypothetical protein BTA51_28460 [Hahella sp. CCB-MM4]